MDDSVGIGVSTTNGSADSNSVPSSLRSGSSNDGSKEYVKFVPPYPNSLAALGQAPEVTRTGPGWLLAKDILVFIRSMRYLIYVLWPVQPETQFKKGGELSINFRNFRHKSLLTLTSLVEAALLLFVIIIACVLVALSATFWYSIRLMLYSIQGPRVLNSMPLEQRHVEDGEPTYKDERWIFINGIMSG